MQRRLRVGGGIPLAQKIRRPACAVSTPKTIDLSELSSTLRTPR